MRELLQSRWVNQAVSLSMIGAGVLLVAVALDWPARLYGLIVTAGAAAALATPYRIAGWVAALTGPAITILGRL